MHGDDVAFALGGAVAPFLGAIVGWIDLPSVAAAAGIAAVGALTSWSVKQILDYAKSKFTK